MTRPAVVSLFRAPWRVCVSLFVMMLSAVPSSAHASLLADRLEISMYGRMGLAWTPTSGRFIMGRSMNLTGSSIGGRFEEGDYLEPTIRLHILEKKEGPEAPYVDMVMTPAMFASNGLFAGIFSTRFSDPLSIELFQAYVESGNVLLPGLRVWGGARFYRGTDVHIADYYYFNNLSGQGGGVAYGPLDLAVLMQTSRTSPQYNFDVDGNGSSDLRRQRSVFVAQYVHKLEGGHSFHGLAEFHLLPGARMNLADGTQVGFRSDHGWVAGVKAHLDLGNGSFNDVSVRYGSRIANGGRGGGQSWDTVGLPDLRGLYTDAASVSAVDHFLYNFGSAFSLNAYGILHWAQGASDTAADKSLDFAVGARGTVYLHDNIHLVGEATYQGLMSRGETPMATATKLTIAPTFVPVSGRSVWTRPHFRIFYTAAFYDEDAVAALSAPYLQTVGPSSMAHYLGARAEWWF